MVKKDILPSPEKKVENTNVEETERINVSSKVKVDVYVQSWKMKR